MKVIDILSGACVRLHFLDSYESETEVDGKGGDRSLTVNTPLNRWLVLNWPAVGFTNLFLTTD